MGLCIKRFSGQRILIGDTVIKVGHMGSRQVTLIIDGPHKVLRPSKDEDLTDRELWEEVNSANLRLSLRRL